MAQLEQELKQDALFVNPAGQRRVDFQAVCGEHFSRLYLADGIEQAGELLAAQAVGLLVIDLEGFERSVDLASLGALLTRRAGRPSLILCPYTRAGWLSALMEFGPLAYAMTPLVDSELEAAVASCADMAPTARQEGPLREQLAAAGRLQDAIGNMNGGDNLGAQICVAMCGLPGVSYAGLLHLKEGGDLQLEAQFSPAGIDLYTILDRYDRLLQSPLRPVFPALITACSGEMSLLDAPAKSADPELAVALAGAGIDMVLGLPVPGARPGQARGSMCLMFNQARAFSREELASLARLAQLAGMGLAMADMERDGRQLTARLARLATTDALTGLVNRRHGEYLLDLEVRRARRYKIPVAVIVFDIDRFMAINDQYGHPVGDAVLRLVAEVTQAGLRSSDVLVRSGGEEFLVIAPHTSAQDALSIAEKIRCAIDSACIPGCDTVTISLGVGQLSDQESADTFTQRVEVALARAKRAGRNCVELAMQ
ncbi:MAG: GGDEF domain-containing protein [Pseudomonadota bacterium]